MGCYCNGKYHYTNMISALATGQISYKDAMCEIMKRLCELENGEYSQVQADWTETETDNPAYIKNKPSVSDLQADWNNSDTNSYGYIKNKPTIPPEQVQADWMETDVNNKGYIKNKPGTTQAYLDTPTLVPPTGVYGYPYVLRADGTWGNVISKIINWDSGIAHGQTKSFQNIINKFQNKADWTETDPSSPSFIQNKPTLPSAQVQSNWTEADTADVSYIQNKPQVMDGSANTNAQLVPGFSTVYYNNVLHQNGVWSTIHSDGITWDSGLMSGQADNFSNLIKQNQAYPTFGGSRGTNLFGMSTDPRNDVNDWSIIQHWPYVVGFEKVDNHYWKFHITAYIADYTCTIPNETMQFYNFGFKAELVFANSGLTWDVYKAAYNANRTYSSVKYFSPGIGTTINVADVGLNATYTNAGGYLGMSDATGSGSVANTLTMGRYFNNSGNETMGFGLWSLQNFQQGSWFEAELWVWL